MKQSRALLVSINDISENTGGGIYLRTLFSAISANHLSTLVCCKGEQTLRSSECVFKKEKNNVTDFLSRLFLSPSFLFFYVFGIVRLINRENIGVVYLHNSRLGVLSLFIKIFTSAQIVCCYDNFESKLSLLQVKSEVGFFKKSVRFLDYFLLLISEFLIPKLTLFSTFITEKDKKNQGGSLRDIIIPVCLPKKSELSKTIAIDKDSGVDILFTGTFTFSPNIKAANLVINLARLHPCLSFVIAGRAASDLVMPREELPSNVSLINSPDIEKMDELFRSAKAYICPVEDGSGMKTKLAEALSYNLPILCSQHSAIGYELAENSGVIKVYNNLHKDFIKWFNSLNSHSEEPYLSFIKFYTFDVSILRLENALEKL